MDFEELVTIFEVVKLGVVCLEANPDNHLAKQYDKTYVDDLSIRTPKEERLIQIKATANPSWTAELVGDFEDESFYNESTRAKTALELCVGSKANKLKMENNKPTSLPHVSIHYVDINWLTEKPYAQSLVFQLLEQLSLDEPHDELYQNVWCWIRDSWKEIGREGSMRELYRRANAYSLNSVKSLSTTQRTAFGDLSLSTNAETLVLEFQNGKYRMTLDEWAEAIADMQQPIESVEEFFVAVGALDEHE